MIFLEFRCVNLILNDVKEVNMSGKLLLIFFVDLLLSSLYFFVSASSLRNCSSINS